MQKINTKIKEELLEKLPDWWQNINADDYYLVMTDDCDSYYSCKRLRKLFGLKVGGFYDFDKGLFLNEEIAENKKPIFVDLSICRNQLCFDNHRTIMKNKNAVNPNVIQRKYSEKYNFSTLTLIMALYGGVENLSENSKTLLLAIDGGYIGYYKNDGKWKDVNIYWLDKLGLKDELLPILEKHDMEYFQNFSADHNLNDKIYIDEDGYLESANLNVPTTQFKLVKQVEKVFTSKNNFVQRWQNGEKVLVSAETYKDHYVLNIEKK